MFRIRRIDDDATPANREAIAQVQSILQRQFATLRPGDVERIPEQLRDPVRFGFRSILLVAESAMGKVHAFAMLLLLHDVRAAFLELISTDPDAGGSGIGSVLYQQVREEALPFAPLGLFLECAVDDPDVVADELVLGQNRQRLKFYERYGARPLDDNDYARPVCEGDRDLYFLVHDPLGAEADLAREDVREVVRAILHRKYGDLVSTEYIDHVAGSFHAPRITRRAARYLRTQSRAQVPHARERAPIALFVNEGHNIHHVRDRGYVEAPVRIPVILGEIGSLPFIERKPPHHAPEELILEVHSRPLVEFLKRGSASLKPGKSIYPIVFPVRNQQRPPRDPELQMGYYCTDTFTPLNANVWPAARGAVDCAVSAAQALLEGHDMAYALVRPPGHHAERGVFGGFCYLNNTAVAAQYLSRYGAVAILDLDYHHGNGQQDIFYTRPDVLTVSIHGAPPTVYPHYAGFVDERGEGAGLGCNLNLPLPEKADAAQFHRALSRALAAVRKHRPAHLVVALGLDTAKDDPTGTWPLLARDFDAIGKAVGELRLPTLVVQEGGYRTRTLGINARHFLESLWLAHAPAPAAAS